LRLPPARGHACSGRDRSFPVGTRRAVATGKRDRHTLPPCGGHDNRRRGGERDDAMTDAGPKTVRPLFSAAKIAGRVRELAQDIAASEPQGLLAVIVLKGGFV